MKLSTITLSLASILTLLGLSLSDAYADRVNRRQQRQVKRIKNGVRNGSVTRSEARRLKRSQRRIRRAERKAKSDGVLTQREKLRLNKMQNKQSKKIFALKHNDLNQGDNTKLKKLRKTKKKLKKRKVKKLNSAQNVDNLAEEQADVQEI